MGFCSFAPINILNTTFLRVELNHFFVVIPFIKIDAGLKNRIVSNHTIWSYLVWKVVQ